MNFHSLSTLSFVKSDSTGAITSMWCATPTGNYEKDCETGKGFADELIERIKERESYGVLFQVAKAMPRSKFGPIEIGFFHRIAEVASLTSANPDRV